MDKLGIGRKMERLVMKRWEWHGFTTWQPPRNKWSSQDIFDLFDFIAVKPNCPVNLVQVKRRRLEERRDAMDAIEQWARDYPIPVSLFLVSWRRTKKRGLVFESMELLPTGWAQCGEWTEAL